MGHEMSAADLIHPSPMLAPPQHGETWALDAIEARVAREVAAFKNRFFRRREGPPKKVKDATGLGRVIAAALHTKRHGHQMPRAHRDILAGLVTHSLLLAEHGKPFIHPGIKKLMAWGRCCEETARTGIREFERWGILVLVAEGCRRKRQARRWQLHMEGVWRVMLATGAQVSDALKARIENAGALLSHAQGRYGNGLSARMLATLKAGVAMISKPGKTPPGSRGPAPPGTLRPEATRSERAGQAKSPPMVEIETTEASSRWAEWFPEDDDPGADHGAVAMSPSEAHPGGGGFAERRQRRVGADGLDRADPLYASHRQPRARRLGQ